MTAAKFKPGKALVLGFTAAAFFSVSFVLNRQLARAEGHWAWSSALRFLMMIPVLAILTVALGHGRLAWRTWKVAPLKWCGWGTLACGMFYAPLVAACEFAPAWLVAATWSISIVIGILTGPVLYHDHRRVIPRRALVFSLLIVAGVLMLRVEELSSGVKGAALLGLALVILSACAHPIGNRGSLILMESMGSRVPPLVRLFLLTLGSLPFWLLISAWGWTQAGPPSAQQWQGVAIVAAAGMIATPLFFTATNLASHHPRHLAAVEATQAAEIVFTMILESWLIGIEPLSVAGWLGLALVLLGFLMHALPAPALPGAGSS